MLASQIISISDLRTKWNAILASLHESHKYIVVNNKPKAVLLSCEEYEQLRSNDEHNDRILFTEKNKKAYTQAKHELVAGDVFTLEQLKQKHATL